MRCESFNYYWLCLYNSRVYVILGGVSGSVTVVRLPGTYMYLGPHIQNHVTLYIYCISSMLNGPK